ncbi:MAG TPA: hypothetical protein VN456_04880 [Desulfosporosinus sp.]|nr:hypothetical protein [Desulfosporosinus sp.]
MQKHPCFGISKRGCFFLLKIRGISLDDLHGVGKDDAVLQEMLQHSVMKTPAPNVGIALESIRSIAP